MCKLRLDKIKIEFIYKGTDAENLSFELNLF